MEVNQLNFAVEVFDQRGATLDPIAGIQIDNVTDYLDLSAMDMAANHSVNVVLSRRLHDRLLVVAHVLNRRLGFVFQIGRQRPIPETKAAPDAVEMDIEVQDPIVKPGADAVEQSIEIHDAVELMAM